MLTATDSGPIADAIQTVNQPMIAPPAPSQALDPAIQTAYNAANPVPVAVPEAGTPGYGGITTLDGNTLGMGGYTDPAGVSHSYADDPALVAELVAAQSTGPAPYLPTGGPPFAAPDFSPLSLAPPAGNGAGFFVAMPSDGRGVGLPAGGGASVAPFVPPGWSLVIGAPGSRGGYGRGYSAEAPHLGGVGQAVRAAASSSPGSFGSRLAGALHAIGTGGRPDRRRLVRTPLTS